MNSTQFFKCITASIDIHPSHSTSEPSLQIFLDNIKAIFDNQKLDEYLKMTKMTILFEGFYRSKNDDLLKKNFLTIRLQRWANHFGTPTLTFLLTYQADINQICDRFTKTDGLSNSSIAFEIDLSSESEIDTNNNIIVNTRSVSKVIRPESDETTGQFVKTYNPFGGFTTSPSDPFSKKFIEFAASTSKNESKVLEIGAGFGAASLQALAKGATVFCNDIEPQNLAVVHNHFLYKNNHLTNSISGDYKKLILIPASFPDELSGLPKESFDAILICRVLHFFSGIKIGQSLQKMASLLKPGGKLFVVCETPFLKNWEHFIPEYKRRVASGMEWPGEITNANTFENSGRAKSLPSFVHWITKEVLDRSLQRSTFFNIEQSAYINRKDHFPNDLVLDGRESVGAIAVKI